MLTAIAARRRGLSALVIERHEGLPEKACGEGLMPGAVAALTQLGVDLVGAREFRGIRFVDAATVASAAFPGDTGRALSRPELMRRLDATARELGVTAWKGFVLRDFAYRDGVLHAEAVSRRSGRVACTGRLLVAADGLRSPIRRRLGLELTARGPERYGLTRHFRCVPWSDWVEVYWHERAEVYVTPLGPEEVGVAVLMHGRSLSHDAALALFPALLARLGTSSERGRVRGAGPLEQRVHSVLAPGVALVGDAAGYLDALTGEGLALGFRSAMALVDSFASGELWRYPREYARITRAYYATTWLMLALSRRPRLRRALVRYLSRSPELFSALLGLAVDSGPPLAAVVTSLFRRATPAAGRH